MKSDARRSIVIATKKKKPKSAANTPVETSLSTVSGSGNGLKVTDTTSKICKPFTVQVMVFNPKSGYKVEVQVEKSCTPQADAVWKLVFDLYKKQASGSEFDQLVHVSYTGGTPVEQRGLESTAAKGLNDKQADVLINRAGPAVLDLENSSTMPPEQLEQTKAEVKAAAKDVATFAL